MNARSTYKIITYGCQMNVADSQLVAGELAARGWERVDDERRADLILVNTCVVRNSAESRAVGRIRQLAHLKRRRPGLVIGVLGCLAQKDGQALLERLSCVDLVLGTRDLPRIGSLVERVRFGGDRLVSVDAIEQPAAFAAGALRDDRLRAMVTIMYGCDNFCSYCIVPYTRGREWSRPADEILAEVRRLAETGWREVTLLGQNVNSYRDGDRDFADLLRRVARVDGLARVRFITSHPKDCSERLIEVVAGEPRVCEHLHLPAQAGGDAVLSRMNRGYSREAYVRLVERIRRAIPHAALTTDLIVGFPGETDRDFADTLDLVRAVRWDEAYMFMYSPREGTAAAAWPDDVPLPVKKERLRQLIDLQERITGEVHQAHVGTRQEILVEGPSRRSSRILQGRTRGHKVAIVPGPESLVGQLIDVRITRASVHTLFGERLEAHA